LRAVNFALNRRAITTQIGLGAARPTDQILPPGMPAFADAKIYPLEHPDVARAMALLGGRHFSVKLYITTDPAAANEAEVIKSNLAAVGITLSIKALTFAALINVVGHTNEPYDMVLLGWAADYPDPDDFINVTLSAANITPANNINLAQFDDPTLPEADGRCGEVHRRPAHRRVPEARPRPDDASRAVGSCGQPGVTAVRLHACRLLRRTGRLPATRPGRRLPQALGRA
jgi:Bacterial extracellular solute-binding proteins, family 5 Middle